MCVAATVFNKISLEYLEAMDADNPHGGGVAWAENGQMQFARGLDAKQIHAMQESGELKLPYLLHFRWATHGDVVAELTHPFPIGPRALFGELRGACDRVLIHNGTWGGYAKAVPNTLQFPDELLDCQSDTAIAAWLAAEDESILEQVPWATAVGFVTDGLMDVTTRGRWYDKDGNWYSNLGWVPYPKYQSFPSYGNYYNGPGSTGNNHYHFVPTKEKSTYQYSEDWEEWAAKYQTNGVKTDTQKLADLLAKHEARLEEIKRQAEADKNKYDSNKQSWDEYLRARYGSRVAGDVKKANFGEELSFPCDDDVISEDPETVNSIIARHMLR